MQECACSCIFFQGSWNTCKRCMTREEISAVSKGCYVHRSTFSELFLKLCRALTYTCWEAVNQCGQTAYLILLSSPNFLHSDLEIFHLYLGWGCILSFKFTAQSRGFPRFTVLAWRAGGNWARKAFAQLCVCCASCNWSGGSLDSCLWYSHIATCNSNVLHMELPLKITKKFKLA